jgi:hypothetical protein
LCESSTANRQNQCSDQKHVRECQQATCP